MLADRLTLALGAFRIRAAPDVVIAPFDLAGPLTPTWDRPTQTVLGLAVAALCLWRGRWAAVPLAVLATRLVIDPQPYPYYTAGLIAGAVILDLTRERRLPLWTAAGGAHGIP